MYCLEIDLKSYVLNGCKNSARCHQMFIYLFVRIFRFHLLILVFCVQELLEDGLLDQFHKSLVELNMDSAEELQSYINKLQLAVEQGRQKLLHCDGAEGKAEVGVLPPNLKNRMK